MAHIELKTQSMMVMWWNMSWWVQFQEREEGSMARAKMLEPKRTKDSCLSYHFYSLLPFFLKFPILFFRWWETKEDGIWRFIIHQGLLSLLHYYRIRKYEFSNESLLFFNHSFFPLLFDNVSLLLECSFPVTSIWAQLFCKLHLQNESLYMLKPKSLNLYAYYNYLL